MQRMLEGSVGDAGDAWDALGWSRSGRQDKGR